MKFKRLNEKYIVRIDKGEEIVEKLIEFCRENKIYAGSINGIGAADKIVLGLFDTGKKEYHKTEFTGDHEITSLIGNISTLNGEVYLHLHVNISNANYQAFGGHLNSAIISGVGEVIVSPLNGEAEREFDDNAGLNVYKI